MTTKAIGALRPGAIVHTPDGQPRVVVASPAGRRTWLTRRTANLLRRAGLIGEGFVLDVADLRVRDLLRVRNLGAKAVVELCEACYRMRVWADEQKGG